MSSIAPTLQLFFTERMARQLQASPRTVVSYRDTCRLLLRFVADRTGKAPSALGWQDLDAEMISAFLDHLEADRHNSAPSRSPRMALAVQPGLRLSELLRLSCGDGERGTSPHVHCTGMEAPRSTSPQLRPI